MTSVLKQSKSFVGKLIIVFAIGLAAAELIFLKPYRVQTGSMEPTISAGSIVIVFKNDIIDIKPKTGEVYAYKKGDITVIHRLVEFDEKSDEYIFKGDANNAEDPVAVSRENIIGRVIIIL